MKRNYKIKLLSLLGMTGILAVPMVSLTSCGKVSQYFLPVIIGGSEQKNGPFNYFISSTSKDFDENSIIDYLPSNYDYYLTPQSSGQTATTNYVYASPNDLSNPDNIKPYAPEWLNATNSKLTKFTYTTSSDPKNHFDSRNYNIYSASTAISTIACNASQLFSYMLYYQLHIVNDYVHDGAKDSSNLDTLYGGKINDLNSQLSSFLEYNYDLSNLMSSSKTHIKFGQSSCGVSIAKNDYSDNRFGFLPTFENKDWTNPDSNFPYAQIKDEDGVKKVTGFDYIPFIFNIDDLSFSYYNPVTSDKTFLPNNWLIQDQDKVKSQITSTKGWNKFFSITGESKDSWTPSLNWTLKPATGVDINIPKSVPLLNANIKSSTFVGLASYGIYNLENGDDKIQLPIFNSVAGIYPSYFLSDENIYNQKDGDDTNWFLDKSKLDKKMNNLVKSLTNRNEKPTPEVIEFVKNFFSNNGVANIADILSK